MHISLHKPSATHPFVQTVCVLRTVYQPLCECVAAGITQCCMFTALQTSLSQQNRPDLTHRLTPLLLPGKKQTQRSSLRYGKAKTQMCSHIVDTCSLLSLVGEPLCEFVEGASIFSLNVSPTPKKLREVRELLLFHVHLGI